MTKAKAITEHIADSLDTRRIIFRVLIASIIVLSIAYAYLIGSITFNVLARKTLENTARTLGAHVSELELIYLNTTSKIDKNYALSLGFVDANTNIFATRTTLDRVAVR